MLKTRFAVAALFAALSLAACGGPADNSDPAATGQSEQELSVTCGGVTCAAGTYCCNASCGMCAPKGAKCPMIACNQAESAPTEQVKAPAPAPEQNIAIGGQLCGDHYCSAGTYCCNPSCGTCVAKDQLCTQQVCGI